jgi:hypothetical protein
MPPSSARGRRASAACGLPPATPRRGRFTALTGLYGDELERVIGEEGANVELDIALVTPPPLGPGGEPECRTWADLPAALIAAVLAAGGPPGGAAALAGGDVMRMRGVCVNWRRALPAVRDCWRRAVHCAAMAGPWGVERLTVPYEALTQVRCAVVT